jgi:hypothetical protein
LIHERSVRAFIQRLQVHWACPSSRVIVKRFGPPERTQFHKLSGAAFLTGTVNGVNALAPAAVGKWTEDRNLAPGFLHIKHNKNHGSSTSQRLEFKNAYKKNTIDQVLIKFGVNNVEIGKIFSK